MPTKRPPLSRDTAAASQNSTALYCCDDATLDDLREAVTTLEEVERTARRVLGGAHPLVLALESSIRLSRKALQTREASPGTA